MVIRSSALRLQNTISHRFLYLFWCRTQSASIPRKCFTAQIIRGNVYAIFTTLLPANACYHNIAVCASRKEVFWLRNATSTFNFPDLPVDTRCRIFNVLLRSFRGTRTHAYTARVIRIAVQHRCRVRASRSFSSTKRKVRYGNFRTWVREMTSIKAITFVILMAKSGAFSY